MHGCATHILNEWFLQFFSGRLSTVRHIWLKLEPLFRESNKPVLFLVHLSPARSSISLWLNSSVSIYTSSNRLVTSSTRRDLIQPLHCYLVFWNCWVLSFTQCTKFVGWCFMAYQPLLVISCQNYNYIYIYSHDLWANCW